MTHLTAYLSLLPTSVPSCWGEDASFFSSFFSSHCPGVFYQLSPAAKHSGITHSSSPQMVCDFVRLLLSSPSHLCVCFYILISFRFSKRFIVPFFFFFFFFLFFINQVTGVLLPVVFLASPVTWCHFLIYFQCCNVSAMPMDVIIKRLNKKNTKKQQLAFIVKPQ